MTENLTSAENRYSGIPTMRRAMKEYHLPEPKFENRRDEFVVTFFNREEPSLIRSANSDNTEEIRNRILSFCITPRSRKEIAEYLKIKTEFYVMSRYVQPLVNSGELQMTIPDKPRSRYQKFVAK